MINKKNIGIIPARYASTRFPGKPLVKIGSKSMIQRVYEQASQTLSLDKIIVATDDQRIFEHVQAFGGLACMTQAQHQSGTDRCAEVAQLEADFDVIINIQGDEPFINPQQIDQLVAMLHATDAPPIATLAKRISTKADFLNPNIVKVVLDKHQRALYFSRSPIPYARNASNGYRPNTAYKHIGLYGFRRTTLLHLAQLSPHPLEQTESLEQLRWLAHGFSIGVGITDFETIGIDTPEDLERLNNTDTKN